MDTKPVDDEADREAGLDPILANVIWDATRKNYEPHKRCGLNNELIRGL